MNSIESHKINGPDDEALNKYKKEKTSIIKIIKISLTNLLIILIVYYFLLIPCFTNLF